MKYLPLKLTAAVLTSALLLAGCNSDTKYRYIETSSSADGIDKNMAVVSTVGPNDASFALIDLGQSPLHAVEDHGVTTGATDYDISAYGKHFYHIGRYQIDTRSEEHTSELQSRPHLVCRLLLEKKKTNEKKKIR